MLVNSKMELFKVKVSTFGKVENNMTVNGKIVKWKVKEDCFGETESNIEVNSNKIDSTAKVFTVGLMAKSTMECGLKVNNTEKEVSSMVIK